MGKAEEAAPPLFTMVATRERDEIIYLPRECFRFDTADLCPKDETFLR